MKIVECFPEIKQHLDPFLDVCHRLYQNGFVCAYDGNVSMRFDDLVLVTPTHLCKDMVSIDDLILVDLHGNKRYGDRQPSSELKMHLAIYDKNPMISCIIHAHPLYTTAIYRNGRPVKTDVLMEAEASLGKVPVIPYLQTGSQELADAVGSHMQREVHACVLEKHGVVVSGKTLEQTYFLIESLERLAKTEYIMDKSNF